MNSKIADIPIVVLGNKIDIPSAASEGVFREAMGLLDTTGKGAPSAAKRHAKAARPIECFMCSIKRRAGYAEGLRWLVARM